MQPIDQHIPQRKTVKLQTAKPNSRRLPAVPPAMLFFGLLACLACGWFGFQVAVPLQLAARLHSENDAIEFNLRKKELQNQTALKQLTAIGTDQGAIAAARAKGYMFANERPLHIQNETLTP